MKKNLAASAVLGLNLLAVLAVPCGSKANPILFWDNNGTSTPGSGVWDNTAANWSASPTLTTSTTPWAGNYLAVFTAGSISAGNITITVNANINFGGLDNNGVGGTACNLILTNGPSGVLTLASGTQGFYTTTGYSTTYNMPITGGGAMETQGGGSLYLNATNSFTGGTILDHTGIVYFTNGAAFGSGPITMTNSGGALVNNASTAATIANAWNAGSYNLNIVPGSGGTTLSGNWNLGTKTPNIGTGSTAGQVLKISGIISGGGGGSFNCWNNGTMLLTGINTYTGPTSNSCPLVIGGTGKLGSGSYPGAITNNSIFTYGSSAAQTLSGIISGTGMLFQTNGTLTLTGINTYTNATLITNGTFIIGGAGLLGSGNYAGNITNYGTLFYNSSASQILSGVMTGGGVLVQNGSGTLTLTGSNTLYGAISNGTSLIIGGSGQLSAFPYLGRITNNGIFTYNSSASQVLLGDISGTGSLVQDGPGMLTLSGTNTYSGNTIINGGTLLLSNYDAVFGTTNLAIAAGGTLDLSDTSVYFGNLSTFSASGTAVPATVKGGVVNFGYGSYALTYDGSHPALTISQGLLVFNSGVIVNVTNNSGAPLGIGTYPLIFAASNNITGTPNTNVIVYGDGLAAGTGAYLAVSHTNTLNLVVLPAPAFSNLTPSQSVLNGTNSITLGGTLSGDNSGTIYPAMGEVVFVTINGRRAPAEINDTTGDFTLNYSLASLPASGTPYPITYSYGGDGSLLATATNTSTTLTVYSNTPVTITGLTTLPNGTSQLTFSGTPGTTYLIEATTNLAPPVTWTTLSTNTADTNGLFQFNDVNSTNYGSQFYRTATQ